MSARRSGAFGLVALLAATAQSADFPSAGLPRSAVLMTIGDALRSGLSRNPDLLNSFDSFLSARINEGSVASTFLPQTTPFFSSDRNTQKGFYTQIYGVSVSQQFTFGPALEGGVTVTHNPAAGNSTYGSDYSISLRQSLLRGADPVVPAEPLREARRASQFQGASLDLQRRRTVLAIYQAYLRLAEGEQSLDLAIDWAERAGRLTAFSRARFEAGSV